MSIAIRIKIARRNAGLSQDQLAQLAGISSNGVAVLEQGVSADPRVSTILKIASALNLSITDLLAAPPPEPEPSGISIKELAKVTAAYVEDAQTEAREIAAKGEGALELAQEQHAFLEQWVRFVNKRIRKALPVEMASSWMDLLRTSIDDLYAVLNETYGYAIEENTSRPEAEIAKLQSVREKIREDRSKRAVGA